SGLLQVEIRLSIRGALLHDPIVFLLGHDELDNTRCVHLRVPKHPSQVATFDAATGHTTGPARYAGNGFSGQLFLSLNLFPPKHPLFLKLGRPRLFFDEAGWIEIPPLDSNDPPHCIRAEQWRSFSYRSIVRPSLVNLHKSLKFK